VYECGWTVFSASTGVVKILAFASAPVVATGLAFLLLEGRATFFLLATATLVPALWRWTRRRRIIVSDMDVRLIEKDETRQVIQFPGTERAEWSRIDGSIVFYGVGGIAQGSIPSSFLWSHSLTRAAAREINLRIARLRPSDSESCVA